MFRGISANGSSRVPVPLLISFADSRNINYGNDYNNNKKRITTILILIFIILTILLIK